MTTVAVCLCTCDRPKMLAACLESLAGVRVGEGTSVHLVVVDNHPEGGAEDAVLSFASRSPYAVHFIHEPRRGISYARNASVEKALSLGSDWLAFIDDDEWVEPDWLSALLRGAERYSADVVCGPVKLVYPEKLPFWAIPDTYKSGAIPAEGASLRTAATCNTLASAKLFSQAPAGFGLRFGENLGLSGSEDAVLFGRAMHSGAKGIFTTQAIAFEAVPYSRMTYARTLENAYRQGTVYHIELSEKGDRLIPMKVARKTASRLIAGILTGVVLPLHAIFGPRRFKQAAIKTGRCFAFVTGVGAGVLGRKSNYYMKIDGY